MNRGHMSKPLAIMLHGYIGAGKTTLAETLESKLPAVRLSVDEWIVQLFGRDPSAETFSSIHSATKKLLLQVGGQALRAGAAVIFDSGHWEPQERTALIDWVQSIGATPLLITLRCDAQDAWNRTSARNSHQDSLSLYIDPNTFEALSDAYCDLDGRDNVPTLRLNTSSASAEEVATDALDFIWSCLEKSSNNKEGSDGTGL